MVSTFYTPHHLTPEEAYPMKGIVQRLLQQRQMQQAIEAQGIQNKYMEPNLIEALQASKLKNKYYGPNMESQIGLRGAQAGHLGAQTRGLDIENKYRPKTLSDAEQKRKIELDYPGFNSTGITGELARYHYMKDHGLLPGMNQGQQGVGMPMSPTGYQGGQEMPGGVMRQQGMPQPGQDMQNPGADYISQLMASQGQQGQSGMGTQMPPGMQDQGRAPQGIGMQGNPGMQQPPPQQPTEQMQNPEMLGNTGDEILDAILKKNKTAMSLEDKKELERFKTDEKNRASDYKVKQNAENDLPKLEQTAKAFKQLIKIAENPYNKNMFGHYWKERFTPGYVASHTNNPDVGTWMTLMEGPIMQTEQALSSKGNQLALKTALASKAGFSDQQSSALAKLKSGLKKVEDSIKHNREITKTKTKYNNNDYVKVETPDGIKIMKYSEAIKLGAE